MTELSKAIAELEEIYDNDYQEDLLVLDVENVDYEAKLEALNELQ